MNACDRCCARAVETWMHDDDGAILRFCLHHGRQYQLDLAAHHFQLVESEAVPA